MVTTTGSQGTTLSIGNKNVAASGDTFEEVGEIVSIDGNFGVTWSTNEFGRLASGAIAKTKNQLNYGTFTVSVGRKISDAGQAAALAAAADTTSDAYNVKITLDDSQGSNPTSFDIKCLVTSYNTSIGDTSSEVTAEIGFEVTEEPDETEAS